MWNNDVVHGHGNYQQSNMPLQEALEQNFDEEYIPFSAAGQQEQFFLSQEDPGGSQSIGDSFQPEHGSYHNTVFMRNNMRGSESPVRLLLLEGFYFAI
jgi:hypothetical protein